MCGGPPSPNDKPVGNKSGRTVKCVKFQKELPGLDAPPWPGEIGQRIYNEICAQCWESWFRDFSIKVINELHLDLSSEAGQKEYDRYMREYFGFEE